ncbi:MAG: metallophosphoesterase [Firmicutes bacterium]|nr:metallophosphoesterase [Bacillota bacterium]
MSKGYRHHWVRRTLTKIVCLWNLTPRGKRLKVARYELEFANLPQELEGYRIVQVSDLHGRLFGENQCKLTELIKAQSPHVILLTGDMMEEIYEDEERRAVQLLYQELPKIAPCYAILGNHERRSDSYLAEILSDLACSQVRLLRNESLWLGKLRLSGLETEWASGLKKEDVDVDGVEKDLRKVFPDKPQEFTVLMAHKPEHMELYSKVGVDLVFSGHAHGGLIKLGSPRRALLAPGQGVFPKYIQGVYEMGATKMVVSQGLGGPRIEIPPEIVVVELKRKPL